MDEMRNRLADLIGRAKLTMWGKSIPTTAYERLFMADWLIDNGVIVMPCKVGDKVYKISRNKVKECEVIFIGISADEKCSYFNFVENYSDGTFYKSYSMGFDVIGKIVFLTKEEAEAALKAKPKE